MQHTIPRQPRRKAWRLLTALMLGTALFLPLSRAAQAQGNGPITINSDTLTVTGDGDASPNQFKGVSFVASVSGGIATFYIAGDLNIASGETVIGVGSNTISLVVGNNATIAAGAIIDVSATGATTGPGGGLGGASVAGAGGTFSSNFSLGGTGRGGAGGAGWIVVGRPPQLYILYGVSGESGQQGWLSTHIVTNGGGNGAAAAGMDGVNAAGSAGMAGIGGQGGAQVGLGSLGSNGGGGSGGLGASNSSHTYGVAGGNGSPGGPGGNGPNGNAGTEGGGGAGGRATGSGMTLSGGGGGGAGGAGGTGGWGGGGGGGGADSDGTAGGAGGDGGSYGAGGAPGNGGLGGLGGLGGGGGGAIEIRALGRLTIAGVLKAAGGAGGFGASGAGGGTGSPGLLGGSGAAGNPGDDSHSGAGGNGKIGGTGGTGGNGGAGAGGTVKLVDSVLDTQNGSQVVLTGGSPGSGENGRYLYGKNATPSLTGSIQIQDAKETLSDVGPRSSNPFLASGEQTPYLPDLMGGAEIYGITTLTPSNFPQVLANAPAGATTAIARFPTGPSGFFDAYSGFDVVFFINLSDTPLLLPAWEFGQVGGNLSSLLQGGYTVNLQFGDFGFPLIKQLDGKKVYATLVPTSVTSAAFGYFEDFLTPLTNSSASFTNGQVLYIAAGAEAPQMSVASASGLLGSTVALSASMRRGLNHNPISGKTITFTVAGNSAGSAVTNVQGVATVAYTLPGALGTGAKTIAASFAGDSSYSAISGAGTLTALPNGAPLASLAGAAVLFSGGSDYVAVPNFGNAAFGGEVTLEFWQKASSNKFQSTLAMNFGSNTNRISISAPYSDGKVYFDFGDITTTGRLVYTPADSLIGTWQHFAFVVSALNNTMSIYRNGVMEASKLGVSTFTHGAFDLQIGANSYGGQIDEVRVWSKARSQAEIAADLYAQLTGAESNLIGYWRMDEGKGTATTDSSGHGYAGTLTNGPTWQASEAPINTINATVGVSRPVTLAAFDVDGNTLTYSVVANPTLATFSGTAPALTLTPTQGGSDTFTYKANDGLADSNIAAVTVNIAAGTTTLTTANVTGFASQTLNLTATLKRVSDNTGLSGRTITFFTSGGALLGTAATDASGLATLNYTIATSLGKGATPFTASYDGASDYVGSTASATLTISNTTPIASLAGAALQFDGISGNVLIPHTPDLNAYPFTVSTWVKTTQNGNAAALVNKFANASLNGWQLYIGQGHLYAYYFRDGSDYVWDGGNGLDGGLINDGNWHHTAFTVDASGGKLYVDGALKNSLAWTGTPGATTTTQPVKLGQFTTFFAGQLDDAQIWNVARPQSDIQADRNAQLIGNEKNLLALYRLDEGAGSSANDGTGKGHIGTLINSVSWVASTAPINTIRASVGTPRPVLLAGFDPDADPLAVSLVTNPAHSALSSSGTNWTLTPNQAGADAFSYQDSDGTAASNTAAVNVIVGKGDLRIDAASVTGANGQTVSLSAHVSQAVSGAPVSPSFVAISLNGVSVGGGTAINGVVTFSYPIPTTLGSGDTQITFHFPGDANYNAADGYGTLTVPNVAPIASLAGPALNFDGIYSYVNVPNFGQTAPTDEVTIEFWQNVRSVKVQSALDVNIASPTNRIAIDSPWVDGKIYFDFGDTTGEAGRLAYTPPVSLLNSWQHFAFVSSKSGNFMNIYRNGVLEASRTGASSFTRGAFDLFFGGDITPATGMFDGQIDELRLWNRARPQSEIQADMNATLRGDETGLLAYYRLDEPDRDISDPNALVIADATGHGYTGQRNGGARPVASGATIDTARVRYNTDRPLTLQGFDANGDSLQYSVVTPPTKGTLTGAAPNVTYTPGATFDGNDTFTYKANDGVSDSNIATVHLDFGEPTVSVGGVITLEGCANPAQLVFFEFRPTDGSTPLLRYTTLASDGSFALPYVPANTYTVWTKGQIWLAQVVPVNATVNVTDLSATLPASDANGDNSVDTSDFGILVGAYGSDASIPGSGYDATADFNCDGLVDVTDFGLLVGNYGQQGDL